MLMVSNNLYYKGYYGKIEYSAEDKVIYGKIMGIHSLISFESESATDIENEFHNAVDDYLSYCEEEGIKPEKTILMED
jgi:predicted HicB family RNase H-like nuclease